MHERATDTNLSMCGLEAIGQELIPVGVISQTSTRLVEYSNLKVHPNNFYVKKWYQSTDPALTQLYNITSAYESSIFF